MTTNTNQNPESASAQESLAKTTVPESTQLTDEQLAQVSGGALDACDKLN